MMKIKPLLFSIALIALCSAVFYQCKPKVNRQEQINQFLTLFSLQVEGKHVDSLIKHFDMPGRKKAVWQLVNLLCGNKGSADNSKAIFKVDFNIADCDIKAAGDSTYNVTLSLRFSHDKDDIPDNYAPLTFCIKEVQPRSFKITDVNAREFLNGYVAFENLVRANTLTDADIYSPQTLAAFKTAGALKGRYDSIPWFQHVNNQTYYYAVKGEMNIEFALGIHGVKDTAATYKMGLVGPDQKELIPFEFTLIHNIGATFPNLIEVEAEHKRGFYNLNGQLVLPVAYDQIFPLNGGDNLAVLRKGDDYYWWKTDLTVSEKDSEIQIADLLPRIQAYGKSVKLTEKLTQNVTECNSRNEHGSVYLPPSYLVDWALLPAVQYFKNPLRKNVSYENASELYELQFEGKTEPDNFFASIFYSIKDSYLGGREGLYEHRNIMVVHKKNNRIYAHDLSSYLSESDGGGILDGKCNISKMRSITDSLYEVVVGADTYRELFNGKVIGGGPEYHYLQLKDEKLKELPTSRLFGFTKYVKMDDDYLEACYEYYDEKFKRKPFNKITPEMLRYMKNEIYADYKYWFKDERWRNIFGLNPEYNKLNVDVTDSLTAIDKFNIAFIDQKLRQLNNKSKVLASN